MQITVCLIIAALELFAQSQPNVISLENVTLVSMEDDRLTPVERVTGEALKAGG